MELSETYIKEILTVYALLTGSISLGGIANYCLYIHAVHKNKYSKANQEPACRIDVQERTSSAGATNTIGHWIDHCCICPIFLAIPV